MGEAVKLLRLKKKIKQRELSKLCNISQTYLSQIENGKKEPTFSIIKKIGDQLCVPLPVILFMSLNEKDVPDGKKEFFIVLNPMIQKMIEKIFISNQI